MNRFIRYAGLGAAALLAACGGSQPPIDAPGAIPAATEAAQTLGRVSQQSVGRHKNLVYVTAPAVMGYILTYPGGKQVGLTNGNAYQYGLCASAGGQVFYTGYIPMSDYGIVLRFHHGSEKPNRTFFVKNVSFESCSVDPTTGHVATTALLANQTEWKVALFQDGSGSSPVYYSVPKLTPLAYCGYDNHGNLFVDGGSSSGVQLAELPAGAKAFSDVTLSKSIEAPGNIQWADGHLTIEDLSAATIDRVTISGSAGKITGRTKLKGAQHQLFQSWIQGSIVVAPFGTQGAELGFWQYPKGGEPTKTVSGYGQLSGVAVSLARK